MIGRRQAINDDEVSYMTAAINPNDTACAEPLRALVSSIEAGIEPDGANMNWFDEWIYDKFSGDWDYSAFAVTSLCGEAFNDSSALEKLALEEGELSDYQRIDVGRAHLKTLIEEGDYGGSQIYVKEIPVTSPTCAEVTLVVAFSEAPTMSEVEFLGGCVKGSDTRILEKNGYLEEYELASVSDEWILTHWAKV